MRNLTYLILALIFFASCGGNSENYKNQESTKKDLISSVKDSSSVKEEIDYTDLFNKFKVIETNFEYRLDLYEDAKKLSKDKYKDLLKDIYKDRTFEYLNLKALFSFSVKDMTILAIYVADDGPESVEFISISNDFKILDIFTAYEFSEGISGVEDTEFKKEVGNEFTIKTGTYKFNEENNTPERIADIIKRYRINESGKFTEISTDTISLNDNKIPDEYTYKIKGNYIKFKHHFIDEQYPKNVKEGYCHFVASFYEPDSCEDKAKLKFTKSVFQKYLDINGVNSSLSLDDKLKAKKDAYIKEMKDFLAEVYMLEKSMQIDIVRNDEYLLCFEYQYFEFSGGAHGESILNYHNLDLENKKELKYTDFIADFPKFNEIAKKYIKEDNKMYFTGIEDWNTVKLSELCDAFSFTEEKLILYTSGQTASVSHTVTSEIPLSELKEVLITDCSVAKSLNK